MSLPRSVQTQIDEAKRLQEGLNPDAEPAATGDESAQDDRANPQTQDEGKQPGEEAQPEGNDKAQPPEQETDKTRDARYWENRFRSLRGKYDAEVPALHKQVADLTQERDTLKEQLDNAPSGDGNGHGQGSLTDQDVEGLEQIKEEYGDDMVSMVQTVVRQLQGSGSSADSDELKEIKQRLAREDEERQQDAEARFWTDLDSYVPNWRELNADQQFLDWLQGHDRLSGTQRQALLENAQQAGDARRVADIFDTYLQESGQSTDKSGADRIPDDQVQPRQSRSTQQPTGETIWTGAQISQFYRDKAANRYSAEEAKRLEADIFQAQKQGRVR